MFFFALCPFHPLCGLISLCPLSPKTAFSAVFTEDTFQKFLGSSTYTISGVFWETGWFKWMPAGELLFDSEITPSEQEDGTKNPGPWCMGWWAAGQNGNERKKMGLKFFAGGYSRVYLEWMEGFYSVHCLV